MHAGMGLAPVALTKAWQNIDTQTFANVSAYQTIQLLLCTRLSFHVAVVNPNPFPRVAIMNPGWV